MGRSVRIIRLNIFIGAAVMAGGYRRIRAQTKTTLKKATRAPSLRRVGGNLRAALWAKSGCADHDRRESLAHSPLVLRKILSEVTPEPQQSNGGAHLRYRWALQPYARSLPAIAFGNADEIGKTLA